MLKTGQIATVVVEVMATEQMVREALAAYRAARDRQICSVYAVNLLRRVAEQVPAPEMLLSLADYAVHGIWLNNNRLDAELLLRQHRLSVEAELRMTQLKIELKKLEIEQLRLELQRLR